ncbi:lithostathine-like [Erythrolamprus reginae]|uniref:lithostathine-like n=1 Tax=Erythrolamprus reginae TaxID=121349 RepID=UPI00396C303C
MLLITCFIFGLLGTLTWAGPLARTVCPPDTLAYRYRNQWYCYQFYDNQLRFEDAELQCQNKLKGHLASIHSDRQAKLIGAYVTQKNRRNSFVWIGYQQDEGSSGSNEWRWVDGSESTYSGWSNYEPTRNYEDSCAGLSPQSGHVTWTEQTCSCLLPFLCKFKPT